MQLCRGGGDEMIKTTELCVRPVKKTEGNRLHMTCKLQNNFQ